MPLAATRRPDPFETLNEAQRAAVDHGESPLLVIAGAGTGKTTTLAARVARLVLGGADPNRILLLSFSRRAAHELGLRAGRMLHGALGFGATQAAPVLPWSGTFHGIGARLLRDHAKAIGLAEQFTIHDRGDAEDLMGLVRAELGFAATAKRFPMKGTCFAIYSRMVNSEQPLDDVLGRVFPWCLGWEDELKQLFRAYVREKQQQHALDYDDLLLYWQQMMLAPPLAAAVGARFDHVLVDEYQDTNRIQATILQLLKPGGQGVTVVGDDAQAIYSFRAAEVRNILGFPAQFSPAASVVTLARNYRSTQPILVASNAVIALAAERFTKALHGDKPSSERPQIVTVDDEMAQARWVADAVLRRRENGLALKRQAVLFRAVHHSAGLELELARRNIPFIKFGGLKFLEAAHVKDLLSVLRWVQNPRSRMAGFRVVQLMPGIGPAAARRLLDAMAAAPDPVDAMQSFQPPVAAAHDWRQWLALHAALQTSDWPHDVSAVALWLQPHLERVHEDAIPRMADLAQLARLSAGYASRERFLTELTLDPPEATSDEAGPPLRDEDYLILSTLHSAKGQEWSAVYILNAVDGCMPADLAVGSPAEIDEERRLLYVGMTRAKQHLALLVPQRFHIPQQRQHGDRHVYGSLTRFIQPAMAPLFEAVGPRAEAADAAVPAPQAQAVDLLARIRGLM